MKFGLRIQAAFMNGVIKFLKWMDLCVDQTGRDNPGNGINSCDKVDVETDRLTKSSEAVRQY